MYFTMLHRYEDLSFDLDTLGLYQSLLEKNWNGLFHNADCLAGSTSLDSQMTRFHGDLLGYIAAERLHGKADALKITLRKFVTWDRNILIENSGITEQDIVELYFDVMEAAIEVKIYLAEFRQKPVDISKLEEYSKKSLNYFY